MTHLPDFAGNTVCAFKFSPPSQGMRIPVDSCPLFCSAPAASTDGLLCNSLCHCTIIPSLPKHFPTESSIRGGTSPQCRRTIAVCQELHKQTRHRRTYVCSDKVSDKVATLFFFCRRAINTAVDPGLTLKFRGVNKVLKPVVKPQCEEEGSSNDHL